MRDSIRKPIMRDLAMIGAFFLTLAAAAPAYAQMSPGPGGGGGCSSDHNLTKVHRRLLGAIQQLSDDQSDYGGHRVAALNDLQAARSEIEAAESYAQSNYHEPAHCFNISGMGTGGNAMAGKRGQSNSNGNLARVDKWVGGMITQLQADSRDYGGHRDNAVKDIQQAQTELAAAGSYTPKP
jgi:hypothetical protein